MTTPTPRLVNGAYEVDGVRYPRVTSVLDVIAKPSLLAWRKRVGDAEADRVSKEGRENGTRIHAACEEVARVYNDQGAFIDWYQSYECADAVRPHVGRYVDWLLQNVECITDVERFLHHDGDGYAGTCDLVVVLKDGRRALLDLKSSKSPDWTWPVQLAAYAQALAWVGEPVDCRAVVNLPTNQPGRLRLYVYDDHARDDRMWRACLRAYRYRERRGMDWRDLKESGWL